jgi:putative endopeptidase
MSEETKRGAQGKLAAIRNRIGHSERWRDYSALKIDRHDFIGDWHRSAVFELDYRLSKLDKPSTPTNGTWRPRCCKPAMSDR